MTWTRSSGILLHPTSLPSPNGIGDLGAEAYKWIDFLAQSKQKLWQVLPLGPTGFADSPYACLSSFAGNPLLISLEKLGIDKLAPVWPDPEKISYQAVIEFKMPLIKRAADNFLTSAAPVRLAALEQFCTQNAAWLDEFALFMSLKEHFEQKMWCEWEQDIALRRPAAIEHWTQKLAGQINRQKVIQFFFFEQWQALKTYANQRGIHIVGDVPIFAAHDSADVWANPELFTLDEYGQPTLISGVPPDYFSETGQRWGNPLYRWERMAERGYSWWIDRVRAVLELVDIVRIDHFRGFVGYWEIPASEPTAIRGRWMPGPGAALFDALKDALGELPILAEDLGVISPEIIQLRERFGFPGMKILQFAFDEEALHASFGDYERNPFLPHNYSPNFVVYTGTHDNDTAWGWINNCVEQERQKALAYLGCQKDDFCWTLIRTAMASVADLAVIPLQDILGLGSKTRMNCPGTVGSNWRWRYRADALTEELVSRLAQMTKLYER